MRLIFSCLALLFLCAACENINTSQRKTADSIVLYDAATDTEPDSVSAKAQITEETTAEPTAQPETTEQEPISAPFETTTPVTDELDPSGVEFDAIPDDTAEPEPSPEVSIPPETVTDPYPANFMQDLGYELDSLPNKSLSWYYNRNTDHQPPTAQRDFDIRTYDAHYLGDINQPRLYLTFDEGYENGYTEPILDILRDKNVQAAFFLTRTYIRDNPELCKRMVEEGHLAANHSWRHKDSSTLTDEEFEEELLETARYFQEITGYTMQPFFRPPAGEYSVRTLALTQMYAYTTVFWSLTHVDWVVDNQPGKEVTYNRVMDNLHYGAIVLLHAVSESNTEALPDIIDGARAKGYEFGSLWELRVNNNGY